MKSLALLPLAVLGLLVTGCGSAQNTPEQAFETLRTALSEERWDLLYDVLPPESQQGFDQQIADTEERLALVAEMEGAMAAEQLLQRDVGLSSSQWAEMSVKQKFAAMFARRAQYELRVLGLNPDYVLGSTVKNVSVRGNRATMTLDDGKGHRTRLSFILVDNVWRFQLGEK